MIVLSQWNTPRFEHFFDPDLRSSFASRLMIWKSAKTMIVDSPLFGIGPGNFGSCYLSYQKYFPPYLEWSVPEPHNIFLAFWLGSGLLGLFSFSFLLLWWFRTIFSEIKKGGNRLILSALTTIMLAILIHGLFDTTYWRMSLAYMFWIVFFAGISSTKTQRDAKSCASTTCPSSNVITN
jgi:O-antigen ligase